MLVYVTACAQNAEDLMDMVNEYMLDDYRPCGGPIFTGRAWVQALIRDMTQDEVDAVEAKKTARRNATNRND